MHFSGGVVLNPIDPLEVTVDLLPHRPSTIGSCCRTTSPATQIADAAAALRRERRPILHQRHRHRDQGVDFIANYRIDLDDGRHAAAAGGVQPHRDDITRISPTPPQLIGFDNTLFSRMPPNDIEFRRFTCAQPEDNVRLTADWQQGVFGVVVRGGRYGDYCSIEAIDQIYSAEWVTDLEFTYRLQAALLGFGDPEHRQRDARSESRAVSNRGGRTFPRNAPFGFNGRYFYGRVAYTF